jgi:hypothetical protein
MTKLYNRKVFLWRKENDNICTSDPVKNCLIAGHWWLTSVILVTLEAEIRRITVRCQPKKIVCETLSQKYPAQKRACIVVEYLPSKCEALSSNSNATKKQLFHSYFLIFSNQL